MLSMLSAFASKKINQCFTKQYQFKLQTQRFEMRETWTPLSTATTIAITIFALLWHYALPTYGMPASDPFTNHSNSLFVQDVMRIAKAAEIHNYMNENIDPCDDFYEFACGNWAKINPASLRDSTGLFELMTKALNRKMKKFLVSNADPQDTETDVKVKHFYTSCTQKEKLKHNRVLYREKLSKIVEEFGGMPAISGDKWNANKFDWLETIAKIAHKYGQNIILGGEVMPDIQNTSVNRVYIGHQEFDLESREMYVDTATALYREAFKLKIAKDLREHLNLSQKLANNTASEIVDFEAALAFGMEDSKSGLGMSDLCELTSVAKLNKKYENFIDIWKLITIQFGEYIDGPVYEYVAEYQQNLVEVIKVTPKNIVANYIMYSLLKHFWLETADTETERNADCITTTKTYFTKNLDNLVYRRYNTHATERDVNMIWSELKQTFREELSSNKLYWMSYDVRRYAIEKLDAMSLEINSYTNDNFTEEFGKLVIDRNDYLTNIKNILEHNSRRAIAKLHEEPKIEDAETFSYTPVNSVLENKVRVPVAMLQPYYLWAASYPSALKFGNLGALIGHELIHSFDDTGRKYDKQGNSVNWWDDQSTDTFGDRTECFVDQYSKYHYNGRLLPRSNLQSENIADNGGVRIAYQSYLKWLQQDREDVLYLETLPKLNYTNKQLFFISWAQVWCNDVHPSMQLLQASTDSHMPGKYRVIGPLSNFPEFAKEFNCRNDKPMNRIKKCEIY